MIPTNPLRTIACFVVGLCACASKPLAAMQIDAGHPGYRRVARAVADVAPGQTTEVELRLRPGGPLQDCRVHPSCALLLREPIPSLGSEDEAFRLTAYLTALAIGWNAVTREPGWYACVNEPSSSVISELKARWENVAPSADCLARGSTRFSHTQTGTPAFFLRVEKPTQPSSQRRSAEVSFLMGGRSGQGWRCDFEHVTGGWRAALCVHVSDY
jgi:hypothetical protein